MADSRSSAASFLLLRLVITVLAVLLLAAPPTGAHAAGNVLLSGESFGAGGRLVHGGHRFILTDKCNLELDEGAVWESGTAGLGTGCRLTLEGDGRLVVRSGDGAVVWASSNGASSEGEGEPVAVLEPRGRVTVYGRAVWSAPELGGRQLRDKLRCLKGGKWDNCLISAGLLTSPPLLRHGGGADRLPHHKLSCLNSTEAWDNCIINGGVPAAGNVLFSGSGRFRLRGGCAGGHCSFLRLDNTGGLAVVDAEDRAIWTNNVRSTPGKYVALLRPDGAVAVYGPAVWSTAGGAVGSRQHPEMGITNVNRKIGGVKMVTS